MILRKIVKMIMGDRVETKKDGEIGDIQLTRRRQVET